MRLLVDAVLPATTADDAPAGVELKRWDGTDVSDDEVVREAARQGCRAAVFFDRNSLSQAGLRQLADELGVGLVAVEARDPVEGKERLLANLDRLRRALSRGQVVLVLAAEARNL